MIHLNKFLDNLKIAESRHKKNFIMTIQEAKDLHTDITKLLMALQEINMRKKQIDKQQTDEKSGNTW